MCIAPRRVPRPPSGERPDAAAPGAQVIAIAGGGITGLAAAYELSRRNLPFLLFEASSRPGGLILTERRNGFTIDGGADSLLVQKPAGIRLCEELALGSRLIATREPRTAFVLKHGRLYPIPSPSALGIPTTAAAIARYRLLPWRARVRLAMEPLVRRAPREDESVASFFRRRFGRDTVHLIAEPLLGGIHAGDVEQLSIASLFPRLVEAERGRGAVLAALRTGSSASPDGAFRALPGGMIDLVDAIAAALPPGSVRLNAPVTGLDRASAGWHVTAGDHEHDAAAVIIAAPAPAAAAWLAAIDADAANICRQVRYASTASVALAFTRADIRHPLAGSGFVVARRHSNARITACTWVSSKWDCRAPQDHVLLRAFLGGVHDPGAVDLADDVLVDTAVRDLAPVLGIRGTPVLSRVFRWRHAGAQHNVGHRARMRELEARLRALPGLFVAGSGFDSIGIPDCVANGRRAAAAAAVCVASPG